MTVENENEVVETDKVVDTQTETKTIKVDVYGEEIELPIEKAKQIIAKRDEKSKLFNEVSTKMKEYETKAAEAARKAAALEAARNGDVAAAEAAFNQKLNEKVDKYRSKIVEGELKSLLLSDESFLGKEALDDAIKLLRADNEFDLADDGTIKSGEKSISDTVKEFLANKPVFRKAVKEVASGGARPAAVKPAKQASILSGLEKFMK